MRAKLPEHSHAALVLGGEIRKNLQLQNSGQGPEIAVRVEGKKMLGSALNRTGHENHICRAEFSFVTILPNYAFGFFYDGRPRGRRVQQFCPEMGLKPLPLFRVGHSRQIRKLVFAFDPDDRCDVPRKISFFGEAADNRGSRGINREIIGDQPIGICIKTHQRKPRLFSRFSNSSTSFQSIFRPCFLSHSKCSAQPTPLVSLFAGDLRRAVAPFPFCARGAGSPRRLSSAWRTTALRVFRRWRAACFRISARCLSSRRTNAVVIY